MRQVAGHIYGPYWDARHKIYILSSGLSTDIFKKKQSQAVLGAVFGATVIAENAQNMPDSLKFMGMCLQYNFADHTQCVGLHSHENTRVR